MKVDQPLTNAQRNLEEEHLELIPWTIHKYIEVKESICGLGFDDLYQEGALALCRAAATFDGRGTQFNTYAVTVIRNHLLDHCRKITALLRNLPTSSLDAPSGDGRPPTDCCQGPYYDSREQQFSEIYVSQLLAHGKRTYSGVARLGIEALELKIRGYDGADIARLYGTKPNHVGAWISRAVTKLKQDMPEELELLLVEHGHSHP